MVRPRKKITKREEIRNRLEKVSLRATRSIGSVESLLLHTLLFLFSFVSVLFGIPLERVLLVLTTVLSLEAIYLAIFIQMSVNQNTAQLAQVEADIDEIQEDVEEIQENVEEISEDIEGIEKDIEEIQEDVEEIQETEDVDEAIATKA